MLLDFILLFWSILSLQVGFLYQLGLLWYILCLYLSILMYFYSNCSQTTIVAAPIKWWKQKYIFSFYILSFSGTEWGTWKKSSTRKWSCCRGSWPIYYFYEAFKISSILRDFTVVVLMYHLLNVPQQSNIIWQLYYLSHRNTSQKIVTKIRKVTNSVLMHRELLWHKSLQKSAKGKYNLNWRNILD